MLQRVQKRSVADMIIEQLAELIESGRLQAGDRVPAELELSAQLGVSRSSVREAMKALQFMGLVERSNDGTLVTPDAPIRLLSRSLESERAQAAIDIPHLFEARRILEGGIAALAAGRATEQALAQLEGLCRRMEAPGIDFESYFSLDMRFHNHICELAGNPVLARLWSVIHELLNVGRPAIRQVREIQHYSNLNHARLLEAFRARDPELAREVVDESLKIIEELLLQELERPAMPVESEA